MIWVFWIFLLVDGLELIYLAFPPFTPPPLFTPAGVKRGALILLRRAGNLKNREPLRYALALKGACLLLGPPADGAARHSTGSAPMTSATAPTAGTRFSEPTCIATFLQFFSSPERGIKSRLPSSPRRG